MYTFTPDANQCATNGALSVTITNQITPTFAPIGPLCQNSVAPVLPTTSENGINGTWSPANINTATLGSVLYTFTPDAGQCGATISMTVTITNQIVPTFDPIGPLCLNSVAPGLPAASKEGITGTWAPATINTSTVGATVYTFTPGAGQCGTTGRLTVTITNQIAPTFDPIGPLCQNSTAPALPATSKEGITGTWNPAAINTTTTGTIAYTFTPDAGQCGTAATLSITIATQIAPTFSAVGPLCQNSTPPVLPATSTNGISGTWNPALVNTATTGTTVYTFTPNAGQCGTPTTLSITITNQITPTFDPVGPLCQNSIPPGLPNISNNGITGSWSPAISTASIGTTVYTFTPDAGQCGTPTTLSITVSNAITPTFGVIGPFCQNSVAPGLPNVSTNGITGTWNPATINTTTIGTTVYTFTPDAGQCGTLASISIVISAQIVPTFDPIASICQNSPTPPTFPATSKEGIAGTWSPSTVNSAVVGTSVYTFTPTGSSCATSTTLNVTVSTQITPTFDAIGPLCQNSAAPALPATSKRALREPGTQLRSAQLL